MLESISECGVIAREDLANVTMTRLLECFYCELS